MPQSTINNFQKEAEKALQHLKSEFAKLQAGRASAAMVENVNVDVYGQQQPIKAVGNISIPEPNQLVIQPWDKNAIQPTEKALTEQLSGVSISNDGVLIRIVIPQPTEERRHELAKTAKNLSEEAKISVRQSRQEAHEAIKNMEKEKQISEDEHRDYQDELQEKVNEFNKKIDDLLKDKENSIMTV